MVNGTGNGNEISWLNSCGRLVLQGKLNVDESTTAAWRHEASTATTMVTILDGNLQRRHGTASNPWQKQQSTKQWSLYSTINQNEG
jgi:hypothetical protein